MRADWPYALMLPTLFLIGVASALAYGPLTIAATDGIDEAEQELAGGLFNASVQFGAALVLAIVTAVNVAATDDPPTPDTPRRLPRGARHSLVTVLVALAITAGGLRHR